MPALPLPCRCHRALTGRASRSGATAGPDVVHVSIGRVEVRATLPPPAVPSRRRRAVPDEAGIRTVAARLPAWQAGAAMSSPLAIGAVSAVLRNLLDNGMVEADPPMGAIKVTAVAPDTIKLDDPDLGPSLNLFLYRVSPNQGWQQRDAAGLRPERRADQQPAAGARTCTCC